MDKVKYIRIPIKIEGGGTIESEILLAERTTTIGHFIVKSIPAFVYGLALNDVIQVLDSNSGTFKILKRSGQITIRLYVEGSLDSPVFSELIDAVIARDGVFEIGKNSIAENATSLLLLSLDVKIGFECIESIMKLCPDMLCQWEYGNVYDNDGKSLDWWQLGKV